MLLCSYLTELKNKSFIIRLFVRSAPENNCDIWISFNDLTAMANGNGKKPHDDLVLDWRSGKRVKKFNTTSTPSEEVFLVHQINVPRFLIEFGCADAFSDWMMKSISAEYEKMIISRIETPLKKELSDVKGELEKWKNGKQDTVYILNFYPYDDGIYKIGLTDKIERRVADLNTGTPSEIIVEYNRDCGNKRLVEQSMHYILEKYRVNPNKEFFRIPKHVAVKLLDNVVDFIDGLHEYMSSHARTQQTAVSGDAAQIPNLENSADIYKMIDSFSVLSTNRARSTLLPSFGGQEAPIPSIYPQATPYTQAEKNTAATAASYGQYSLWGSAPVEGKNDDYKGSSWCWWRNQHVGEGK